MMFTTLRRTRARERSHANESHRGRSRRETSRRTLSDENTHQNLHRLVAVTDGDVRGNLFVTADTERTDGVSRLGEDRLLTGELLQNLYSQKRDARRDPSVSGFPLRSSVSVPNRARSLQPTRTLDAFVRRSPLSPTQMLRTSLWMRIARIGFSVFSSACGRSPSPSFGQSLRCHSACVAVATTHR